MELGSSGGEFLTELSLEGEEGGLAVELDGFEGGEAGVVEVTEGKTVGGMGLREGLGGLEQGGGGGERVVEGVEEAMAVLHCHTMYSRSIPPSHTNVDLPGLSQHQSSQLLHLFLLRPDQHHAPRSLRPPRNPRLHRRIPRHQATPCCRVCAVLQSHPQHTHCMCPVSRCRCTCTSGNKTKRPGKTRVDMRKLPKSECAGVHMQKLLSAA